MSSVTKREMNLSSVRTLTLPDSFEIEVFLGGGRSAVPISEILENGGEDDIDVNVYLKSGGQDNNLQHSGTVQNPN